MGQTLFVLTLFPPIKTNHKQLVFLFFKILRHMVRCLSSITKPVIEVSVVGPKILYKKSDSSCGIDKRYIYINERYIFIDYR